MNAFLDLADRQITAPVKARQRAIEKRAAGKATEGDQLRATYRQWRQARREALLAGPHGDAARRLLAFLGDMTLDRGGAGALLASIEQGPWRHADADTRFEILSLVDGAIIALRERHGLCPFDDALPGKRPSGFLLIREALA